MRYQGTFRGLNDFLRLGEIISGDKIRNNLIGHQNVLYLKRDFLFHNGNWRGDFVEKLSMAQRIRQRTVLVTGHSDYSSTLLDVIRVRALGIKHYYGNHVWPIKNFSYSMPIGVTNDCDDSRFHRILGNLDHFRVANSENFSEVKNVGQISIYVNFTVANNRKERLRVLSIAQNLDRNYKITLESPSFDNESRIRYLQNLRSHTLVLCPEGNGIDTHRLWETLYMGGIPTVVKNYYLDDLYNQLPILRLDNWSELNNANLIRSKIDCLHYKEYDFGLISNSYWIAKIARHRTG